MTFATLLLCNQGAAFTVHFSESPGIILDKYLKNTSEKSLVEFTGMLLREQYC